MKSKNKVQSVAALAKAKQGVVTHDHPGRPRYEMKFPRSAEWTFTQLMAANGVETDKSSKRFGKGDRCSMLTLRKNLKHDMFRADGARKATSLVVEVKGVTAEPDSDSGLGRRATLYRLRSVPAKDHSTDKPAKKMVKLSDEVKAILAEPVQVVTIVPTPAPEPVAEPVADNTGTPPATATLPTVEVALNETPAPVAEVEAAPVAEPVVAP